MINKKLVYIICSFTAIAIVGSIFSSNVMADNVNYDVTLAPSIMVSIPTDTVTLNLNPFVSAFGSTDLAVTVGTNNPTGYTLTMSPSDDTTTSLTRTGGTETIPTLDDLSGGYTEQTFATNKWGYKLSSTNYLPFATSNEIAVTDAPSNATTSTVTFATKADTTLVSGAYNLEITFTAVANYVPPATIDYCAQNSIADANCMQKMVASNCTTTAKTVMDSRDGEQYLVQELADGNCWLLDNLRLDLGNSTVLANTTADNTNASTTTLNYLKNGGGSTSDQYATTAVSNWTSSYSFSAPLVNMDSKDVVPSGAPTGGSGSNKVGGYYNFCAASAGSYCYGDGTSAGTSSGNATEDICPKGWRMPTSGSSGEYQALYVAYSSNVINFKNALSTPLSGVFYSGSADLQGSRGYFWSSTRNDDSNMYYLRVNSSGVYPQNGGSCLYGYSVRCLFQ